MIMHVYNPMTQAESEHYEVQVSKATEQELVSKTKNQGPE